MCNQVNMLYAILVSIIFQYNSFISLDHLLREKFTKYCITVPLTFTNHLSNRSNYAGQKHGQ